VPDGGQCQGAGRQGEHLGGEAMVIKSHHEMNSSKGMKYQNIDVKKALTLRKVRIACIY
jgi:hypothetical protein